MFSNNRVRYRLKTRKMGVSKGSNSSKARQIVQITCVRLLFSSYPLVPLFLDRCSAACDRSRQGPWRPHVSARRGLRAARGTSEGRVPRHARRPHCRSGARLLARAQRALARKECPRSRPRGPRRIGWADAAVRPGACARRARSLSGRPASPWLPVLHVNHRPL